MKISFIGTGNMGSALAKAAALSGMGELLLANRTPEKAERLAAELAGTIKVCSGYEAASEGDYIFIGVKPQMYPELFGELKPALKDRKKSFVLVSMAAGITIEAVRELAGGAYPVIRIMPNTPAAVGEGVILYDCSENVSEEMKDSFLKMMKPAGYIDNLEERLMDAGAAVSGCGPAFVYMFAEALAEGAVACGLPRKKAAEYACRMLAGAAMMLLESGENPGKLKDDVCSPGGTTICGVRALEEGAFRADVMNAVIAAYDRTLELKDTK